LTFDQISQLKLEIRLIDSIFTLKLCDTTPGSKNHVFSQFGPTSAFIWHSSGQLGMKV